MKKWMFSILAILGSISFTWGQTYVCGTVDQSAIKERTKANKRALKEFPGLRNGDVYYIPLQFHIVTTTEGEGALGEEKLLEQLNRLNWDYDALNIHFYIKHAPNYIPYTKLYENPRHNFSKTKMIDNFVDDAINIYIVNTIGDNDTGTTLGYFSPDNDWIVAIKSRIHDQDQTLSHEMGHFLSLMHPFFGWEACPYNSAQHGNPINITNLSTACSGALIELVDGSNCEEAADLICDTPPDYNFGITDPEQNCKLDFEVKDYNGDVIDVMENNFMSYFFNCSDYVFSPEQMDLMRADFQSSKRSYIRSNYVPDTSNFNPFSPVIVAPENNSTTQYFDHVLLDWNDVPNANSYLVKVTTGFFTKVETYYHVKNKSDLLLTELPANENNIAVLVWAYNEGNAFNSKPSATLKFKTSDKSVAVQDLAASGKFKIFPSPASLDQGQFTLWSEEYIPAAGLKIVNLDGQQLLDLNIQLMEGHNQVPFNGSNIKPGMYIFYLNTGEKTYSKKILFSN